MKFIFATALLWSITLSQWVRPSASSWRPENHVWQAPELATQHTAPKFSEFATQRASDDFSKEVAQLVSSMTISEERLQAVPQVLQDLELVLNVRWPGCRVIMFGSIPYGLALRGSDVDCTIILTHRTDASEALRDASNTLRQYPKLFSDLYHYTGLRIPVMTLQHTPTQFKVDLTVNNLAGIRITDLLRYFIRSNEPVYNVFFIVKYWARVHKLTGSNSLPNYGLNLMVIFYLQQRSLLPSVASLQANATPFEEIPLNLGYNEAQYASQNKVTLNLLIRDFFEYYVNFDYDKYIISPYAGYPIEKRTFADLSHVPNEFGLYLQNVKNNVSAPLPLRNRFVLQDVFIHNNNVAELADAYPDSTLMKQFRFASKTYRENNNRDFLKKILLERL